MRTSELTRLVEDLYGAIDWASQTGVLHVAAIARAGRAVIALGEKAPRSATDRCILGFARARADAILTTGAILRAEPDLLHRYAEDEETDRSWREWRKDRLGRDHPPALIVLSGSGDFPLDHPALHAAEKGLIWTTPRGQERVGERVGSLIVAASDGATGADGREPRAPGGAGGALARARAEWLAETISIEAGPTTASTLYADPVSGSDPVVRIDELLLSRFEGRLHREAVGPSFVPDGAVRETLGNECSLVFREEESGQWSFERYRRGPSS